jgi:putative transcriptional regulator
MGALGLIVNRPTPHDIPDALTPWEPRLAPPAVVHRGGPVQLDGVIALGRQKGGMVETVDLINAQPYDFDEIRLFHGYSGWGAGQLEDELAEDAWYVIDSCPEDIFSRDPKNLWRSVLRRQPAPLSWLGQFPDEVTLN